MNILGIDPGTGRTGWGVVIKKGRCTKDQGIKDPNLEYIAHGCITTEQDMPMHKRLLLLHKSLNEIIKSYKPDIVIIEQIFFGRNTKTAITVGQAKGVIMLSAAKHNLPIFEYTSISVKHLLSGNGRTDKKDMQKVVRRLLSKNIRKLSFNSKDKGFDDAADALAIAIYHAFKIDEV